MTNRHTRTLQFRRVLTPDGILHDQAIHVDVAGRIAAIVPATGGHFDGFFALPGMPNAHSHCFQRAISGFGEQRLGEESFWSWREAMYRAALKMTPEDLYVIARLAFAEMLRSGFTSVAEFHYLHHLPDGSRGEEMARVVLAAAGDTGIRIRLLPVAYFHGGFGQSAHADQHRFVHRDIEEYLQLLEKLQDASPGIAPHSLRAVDPDQLPTLVRESRHILGEDIPIHIHIAEQQREVDDCRSVFGIGPIDKLFDSVDVDRYWNLVHATHATEDEQYRMIAGHATVVLCPITEASLGDGIFPATEYRSAGGTFSIGSDSNCRIDLFEELRLLEYGQRLRDLRRARLSDERGFMALYQDICRAGARGMAEPVGEIKVGMYADILAVDEQATAILGHDDETMLDALIINGDQTSVDSVFVGGERVLRTDIRELQIAFSDTVKKLMQE